MTTRKQMRRVLVRRYRRAWRAVAAARSPEPWWLACCDADDARAAIADYDRANGARHG